MPLTPAEKQRRYRERRDADEARRQANIQKDRQRWHKNKTVVADMSERQHRRMKRKWTADKRKQRMQTKLIDQINEQFSPPATPVQQPDDSGSGFEFSVKLTTRLVL
jgi:hypothetical protein